MKRSDRKNLEDLPNVGPATAADLRLLGIRSPRQLVGHDPVTMYESLCRRTGKRHDPCVIDVFTALVRFMGGDPARPWWFYTKERKAREREANAILKHLRGICLSLPDTVETPTWGQPHFRVKDKIFCGYGEEKGKPVVAFKLEKAHAELVVDGTRFWRAPYVGHAGWVSMAAAAIEDWSELRSLILESYRLIAPKSTLAKLDRATPKRARN